MPKVDLRLCDWDTPRNPQFRLYVVGESPHESFRTPEKTDAYKAFRACLPGKLPDFIESLFAKHIIRQVWARPSALKGFVTQVRLEPELELVQPHPFTKHLLPIVEHAELSQWAGPPSPEELASYDREIEDPDHHIHSLTDEQRELCARLGVAIQKLATA